MNLAYSLCEENITNINSQKEQYLDKIFSLTEYRDCKQFVSFVNNSKIFSFLLLSLEIDYIDPKTFNKICSVSQELINMVKKYPAKQLKNKYLRLDNDELEAFNFIKSRYEQIQNKEFYNFNKILNNISSYEENESDFESIPINDLIIIMLGSLYDLYAIENADFLNPFTKKIIKKSYIIAHRYSLIDTNQKDSDFEKLNKRTNIQYKRALNVLAQ